MTEKNNEKKDQFHKGGIYTDSTWNNDSSKRKLFSLERNNNYVRIGVRRWDDATGKYNFKMSAGVSVKWDERIALLRQLLNMKKAVDHIVDASPSAIKDKIKSDTGNKSLDELNDLIDNTYTIVADKMYYECPLSVADKGEIVFQVKTDADCKPIAGITIKTEDASEFYIFDNANSLINVEMKVNDVYTIGEISSVQDKIDDLYKSAKSYFYDFGVRDSFLSKMLGDKDGKDKKFKEVEDEDSPF